MTDADLALIARNLGPVIRELVAQEMAGVLARLTVVEQRGLLHGRDGRDGKDGTNGRDAVMPDINEIVARAVAMIPVPKDGAMGPQGERGERGEPGEAGPMGPAGPAGPQGEPGERGEAGLVGPAGAAGEKGMDGAAGEVGPRGERGERGEPGEIGPIGPAGMQGEKGMDGRDGVNLEPADFAALAYDADTRTLEMTFARGDRSVTRACKASGIPLHRDVYVEGRTYEAGDCVTWGGSTWYAKEAVSAKPGINTAESRKWVLIVKRGSEGRKGDKGDAGPPGPKGDRGPERW